MDQSQTIAVQRPKRWDEPLDSAMSDADVAWLRTRSPFSKMDRTAFPKATPLDGILRYDCRLHRVEPGEIVVREGDYGNSAFLVITGTVRAMIDSLPERQLGREATRMIDWIEALKRYLGRSPFRESRTAEQVSLNAAGDQSRLVRDIDDRQAVFLQDTDAVFDRYDNVALSAGELFGEVAAMYRSPRSATVIAETEAALLEIRWQGLRVLRRDRQFADTLETHYRKHWLPLHLREIPLLRFLPEENLANVIEATQLRSYGRLEWNADYKKTRKLPAHEQIANEPLVLDQGQFPTELIVVRSGFARMCVRHGAGHQTTAYLGKGHFFGLEEIAYNACRPETMPSLPYQHSLHAVGFLDALAIPVETFATEILPFVRKSELPEVARHLIGTTQTGMKDRRKSRRSVKSAEETAAENLVDGNPAYGNTCAGNHADMQHSLGSSFDSTSLLEFVVQNRFNNGRDAMVIDLHRCTRCDDCVRACADVHDNNPRFVRQGAIHDRLQFVQACMHCTDPVCMIGCPTGAIARDRNTGVVSIHDSICVGCGVCSAACPYENIAMVEVNDKKGRAYVDQNTGRPIKKATKCDQCSGLPSGPACVAACPHDAIVRIDLSESAPLTDWLGRRS